MLQRLFIQNYALIDQVEIDFEKGLCVITGETGAGKSILLGALALIVGQRADSQVLQEKSKKCIVEAAFHIKEYDLKNIFEENELDYEELTVLRREITSEGKSRAFVNDTPVNLSVLKDLGQRLIDVHSQHETLILNESVFQLNVVDAIANNRKALKEYQIRYKEYITLQQELNRLKVKENQDRQQLDYLQFQFNELEEAALKEDEQQQLENELNVLSNSEEIKRILAESFSQMNNSDQNILRSLHTVKTQLTSISKYDARIEQLMQRVESALVELKDIAGEIEHLEEETSFDPDKIEKINHRLDTIYTLQKKHRVNTITELLELKASLGIRVEGFNSLEDQIKVVSKKIEENKIQLLAEAQKISTKRNNVLTSIEKQILETLIKLTMPNVSFKIELKKQEEFNEFGIDRVKFLFSANKGSELRELGKVASGGELSRLMLAIKWLVAKHSTLPTIVFDEIDTGVSGEVAAKIGLIMEDMSKTIQVMAITHLPQIASKGKQHYFVFKEVKQQKTVTQINKLTELQRIQEIAKMLSVGEPTSAAIKNAKELLSVEQ